MPWWVFVIIIAAVGAVIGISAYLAAQRRKAMRQWARSQGLRFSRAKDRGYELEFGNFEVLTKGSNRYAYNVMRGERDGREVRAFDYHYETYSTDSDGRRQTNHHRFSAVMIATPLTLKPLFIRPEGWFDSVTEFFGHDDIDLELSRFNDAFYVKGPDRRWAFDVLHQETMEFLLNQPQFTVDMEGPAIIVYRSKKFDVDDFDAALNVGEGLIERLPDTVRAELKGAI